MGKLRSPVQIRISVALLTLAITACGGGGGGAPPPSGPVTSTLSFPLASAFTTLAANGGSATLSANGDGSVAANGDCTGTFSVTAGPANTPANFEGVAGFSAAEVATLTFTNCLPANTVANSTEFYSSTFVPLGFTVAGVEYAVWRAAPNIPVSVKVGDSGIAGTIDSYTDSTKTVSSGRYDESWSVLPDTANTAIVMVTTQNFDAASVLQLTETDQYRITSTGALTLIAVDVQQVNPPLHLFFK